MHRAQHEVTISGRGGTDLQHVLEQSELLSQYDGLVIFTDGEAPTPHWTNSRHPLLLWVLSDYRAYECHRLALIETGRVTWID